MAENDQDNDEYKFDELDSAGEHTGEEGSGGSEQGLPPSESGPGQKDVRRNALITVGVIFLIYILYKIFSGLFPGKTQPVKPEIPPMPSVAATQPAAQPIQPVAVAQPVDNQLKEKVSDIEANQLSIKSEVTSVNEQVGAVNTNVNNLSTEVAKLNQTIQELATQLQKQNEVIVKLMERSRPKKVRSTKNLMVYKPLSYNIQAVIPGRAWLIATNGSTLTVREGTKIRGYGMVRLIDSIQGRVLTSSGRVIKFSQADS